LFWPCRSDADMRALLLAGLLLLSADHCVAFATIPVGESRSAHSSLEGIDSNDPDCKYGRMPGEYFVFFERSSRHFSGATGYAEQRARVEELFSTERDIELLEVFARVSLGATVRTRSEYPSLVARDLQQRLGAAVDPVCLAPQDADACPFVSWGVTSVDHNKNDCRYNDGGLGGAGVRAYVVDSGVLTTHTEFGDRAVDGFTPVFRTECQSCGGENGRLRADDECEETSHGTHVAGTLGGSVQGVARNVTIVPVLICFSLLCNSGVYGCASTSDIIKGLEWVHEDVDRRPDVPAVLSFSISAGLISQFQALIERNVTVVASAGNGDEDDCEARYDVVSSPSKIIVGNVDRSWSYTSSSNYGSCLALTAPGESILSAVVDGTNESYDTKSGTSMATPHVAGAAAQILQLHPDWTPAQVKEALVLSARPLVRYKWTSVDLANVDGSVPRRKPIEEVAPQSTNLVLAAGAALRERAEQRSANLSVV